MNEEKEEEDTEKEKKTMKIHCKGAMLNACGNLCWCRFVCLDRETGKVELAASFHSCYDIMCSMCHGEHYDCCSLDALSHLTV